MTENKPINEIKKYEVELTQKELYVIEIEAEDEAQAREKAIELFDKNKKIYYYDSDTIIEVFRSEQ